MDMQLIFTVVLCLSCLLINLEGKKQPNIIFILADDLGWNDVSFHGSSQIPTPNLDTLAYSGVLLNNYYVSPICTPSRSAIMTGKHPIHTERLLPEWLRDLGYSTHMVGKWHLGQCKKEYTPTYRGFDSHVGYLSGMEDYYNHIYFYKDAWGYDFYRNLTIDKESLNIYSTDLYTDEAIDVIRRHDSSRPLFLYLAHQAVHSSNPYEPLQAPPEVIEKFNYIEDNDRRIFAATAYKMDESVGRVVSALDEAGLLLNSIIVFSTDNGGPAEGFNDNAASNWPLRGVKDTLWEGGVRGAGFLWSPLLNKRGRVASQMMDVQDWLPTLYHAGGGNIEDLGDIDGVNVWEALSEDSESPRNEVLHNIDDSRAAAAVRKGDWKLVDGMTYGGTWDGWYGPSGRNESVDMETLPFVQSLYAVNRVKNVLLKNKIHLPKNVHEIRKGAKVQCGDKPETTSNECNPYEKPCLFNIAEDPCEYRNLAEKYPDILADLQETLGRYRSTAVPPVFTDDDPNGDPKYYNHMWVPWMDEEYKNQHHKLST